MNSQIKRLSRKGTLFSLSVCISMAVSARLPNEAAIAHGVVELMPTSSTMLVLVKESEHTSWINRQLSVRLRGIVPASRSGSGPRDGLQLGGLLLGQMVSLLHCAQSQDREWLVCDVEVRLQHDARHNVAELLVANGLARRQ